ncbi:hypothetical protein ACIGO9_30730 [Nocardia asteroides]|uniref:hypothetical protein n=1 Tax=Nocardia asteroides TaxID=1824 RepID=UPI0037C8C1BD
MHALSTFYYSTVAEVLAQSPGDDLQIDGVTPTPPVGAANYLVILGWVMWAGVIACIGGFVVAAAMLAYQRFQGGGGDAQGKLVGAMIGAALIGMSLSVIGAIMRIDPNQQ